MSPSEMIRDARSAPGTEPASAAFCNGQAACPPAGVLPRSPPDVPRPRRAAHGVALEEWDALFRKVTARLTLSVDGDASPLPAEHEPIDSAIRAGVLECVAALEELRQARIRQAGRDPAPPWKPGERTGSGERLATSPPGPDTTWSAGRERRRNGSVDQVRREMSDAMTVVAHELRNPLAPIRTVAAMLGRARSEEMPRLQAIIERQVTRMSNLIADLIDIARADAGKLRLRREVIDMRAVVAEAVDTCRPGMNARAQRLETELPPQMLQVDGDPGRLVQVLCNLLDNASKYTADGGVIGLCLAAAGDDLRLAVRDNGIGISAQALPHVFERFLQEQHATDFNGTGLGIGLAVVRELVQAHGGSIQARSAGIGQGSQFVVTLPLHGIAKAAR